MFNILVVEDDQSLRDALADTLELVGYKTLSARCGKEALSCANSESVDLVISDIQMKSMDGINLLQQLKNQLPNIPVILMTAYGSIQQAVNAMNLGAVDYLVKPFEPEVLVSKVNEILPEVVSQDHGFVAVDDKSKNVQQLSLKVAASEATILVTGPSGAGKEVVVRYIHENSARREQPFVAINCAAIPENMLEAMLFGYTKGAFTGAYKSSIGKFEQAQKGTLLLDEISEMSLPLQAKLLRVLQEREVERLGDNKAIELDVRVIATSNRDLREHVTENKFREDLYYRLNVIRIDVPELAQRSADILPLAEYLLSRCVQKENAARPELSQAAQEKLVSYTWPGNVRELDNIIQRAYVLHANNIIMDSDIQFENEIISSSTAHTEPPESDTNNLKEQETVLILDALRAANGSRKIASEKLGISPRTLRYKIARLKEEGMSVPATR